MDGPKVHNVFYELIIYIEKFNIPLGIHSEQKLEAIHKALKPTWESHKKSENHPEYREQLESTTDNFNSFNLIPGCNKKV